MVTERKCVCVCGGGGGWGGSGNLSSTCNHRSSALLR